MLDDFKRALARVQSDYGFYIECQANPAVALAGYDLTLDERAALSDPEKLASVLKGGIGVEQLRITIKISGTHDWVNRTRPRRKTPMTEVDLDARIATEVEAVRKASADEERTGAAFRLMGLIG
jgi:hypothetical protein